MAWPRNKNSSPSAQPPSDSQVTVGPAPDAQPAPGSGQNTGVTGAAHAVADTPSPGRGLRLPPIRFAHSGADAAPATAVPAQRAPAADTAAQDQTAGLVYEAPPAGRSQQPTYTPYDEPEPDEPADEGLAIFGGVATTEVPQDPPRGASRHSPDYEPRRPAPPPSTGPSSAPLPPPIAPLAPPAASAPSGGAAWNEPIAPAPRPAGEGAGRRPRSFRRRTGGSGPRVWRRGPAPGPGGSKSGIRDLPPDVRMRFWRWRAVIMVVAGLLFGILTKSWVIGLTFAVLAGIIDTGYRSWNATSYANGASQTGAHKRTRRQLTRLRRAGYFTLDARPIPDSPEVIDHLVVGPTGVYALDSEKWNPKLPIRTWNGKKLYHGPDSQKPRLEHAAWEAQQVSEVLTAALGTDIIVRPALAIYGPKVPWDIAEIRGVDVFSGKALRKYFRRRGKMRGGVAKLTGEQARTIYDTASRLLPDISASRTSTPVG